MALGIVRKAVGSAESRCPVGGLRPFKSGKESTVINVGGRRGEGGEEGPRCQNVGVCRLVRSMGLEHWRFHPSIMVSDPDFIDTEWPAAQPSLQERSQEWVLEFLAYYDQAPQTPS